MLALLLCAILIAGCIPTPAFAANYDISAGSITINDSDTHTVSGSAATGNYILVTGGSPVITISGLGITAPTTPALDIQAGDVTLILEDSNSLTGGVGTNGVGCAGIRVAPGASLTIANTSTGSLTAIGGNGTTLGSGDSGAGIGSNGWEESFGTITINEIGRASCRERV